jgi:hypothetical protein
MKKIWFMFMPVVFLWYSIARWHVYYALHNDLDTLSLLIAPWSNKMAVICSIYLFSIAIYHLIKPYLINEFINSSIYRSIGILYSFTTILIFIHHCYSFGWFIEDLFYGSNTIKLIDWCLDPLLLLYFTYPTINLFFYVQKRMAKE